MAQSQQAVEQPVTESAELEAGLERLFGGTTEVAEPEQPEGEQEAAAEEAATEEVSEAEPELVEVDIDGESWQVPAKIKDRIMAERDYTLKTTEVANTRRALEVQQKEVALFQAQRNFEQTVAPEIDRLKMIDSYIQHEKSNTDWAKLSTDEIVRKRVEIDQLAEQRNELAKVLQAKHSEFTTKLNSERAKLKESAKEILSKAIPSWSAETEVAIQKYVQSQGYPEAAAQNFSALDTQLAWKAMQYDRLKAETKGAVKKASEAPVIAPTARKIAMPKQVRAKLDLKNAVKSGKQANIAAAVDKRLDQLFGR